MMTGRRLGSADLWTSAAFTLLGVALIVVASTFPSGVRGVPGPAFFPVIIGGLLAALSAALGAVALRQPAASYWNADGGDRTLVRIAILMLLVVAYVALWNVVPSLVRTPLALMAIYRLLRQSWRRAVWLAVAVTVALHGIFEGLLSISL